MATHQQKFSAGKHKRTGEDDLRTAVRLFIVFLVLCAVIAGGIVLFFHMRKTALETPGNGFLTVREIIVKGNTRYDNNAIIAYSGIVKGQSAFRVNKVRAAEQITAAFPYIDGLQISTPEMGRVVIDVRETQAYVAVELPTAWAIVGENNRIVEMLPHEEFHAVRYPRISGAVLLSEEIGGVAFDKESFSIVCEILDTASAYKFEHIAGIDMAQRARVTVNWNNRIEILLGTMLNTDKKFAASSAIMERLLSEGDPTLAGTLDVSSYSGNDPEKYSGVFLRKEYQSKSPSVAQ